MKDVHGIRDVITVKQRVSVKLN